MSEWKPIETAPDTPVLAYMKGMILVAIRSNESPVHFQIIGGIESFAFMASHWMPLPEPPKEIES